jgi:hypothetical protein
MIEDFRRVDVGWNMVRSSLNRRAFVQGLAVAGLAYPRPALATPRKARYRFELIELYVRVTPPGRLAVAIGTNTDEKPKPERNPIAHVRMVLSDAAGNTTYGCSGDRMSVRWLDKREGRTKERKLHELVALIEQAREIYLAEPEFDDPFAKWRTRRT